MKTKWKKIMQTAAFFMALLGMLCLPKWADLTYADGTDAGGTMATAMEMTLNSPCSDTIASGDDVDVFRVKTTAHGYFQVSLKKNSADNTSIGNGWNVKVLDDKGTELVFKTNIHQPWTSVVLPYAEAGRTFYVQVASSGIGSGVTNCIYDLTVTQTETEEWEAELNDTRDTATEIAVNQTYHGNILDGQDHSNRQDQDYFRFQTTAHGYFQVSLKKNDADNTNIGNGWNVKVLDDKGTELVFETNIHQPWTSVVLPYAEAGRTFYVQVASSGIGSGVTNCTYDLTVAQTAADDWELESNETMAAATSITTDRTYNGITLGSADQDYYSINIAAAGRMNVNLKASPANQSGMVQSGWDIFVYDGAAKEVASLKQVTTENTVELDVSAGIYYVKIAPHTTLYSSPKNCLYSISTSYVKAPAKPKLSSVKAKKKMATVKWKKVADASGYYIYRSMSKKGEYKKVKTIPKVSTVSWKNKKLKSGKRYYYKVVAYKTQNGITAVSPYSAQKSVKVK